jgi:DNA helicase II / ATP-dependent DNA helicase PcrA
MVNIEELNKIQLRIVTSIEGPIMVLAGAGSGKTRVITYRIAYLVDKGINNILVLTFTNKAAKEIIVRLKKLGINIECNVWIGTFHSIFNRILRNEAKYLYYYSTIYDQEDSKKIIKKILKDLKMEDIKYSINYILNYISNYKNNLIINQYNDIKLNNKYILEIYKAYIERCVISKAMDFDDILLRSNELFIRYPNILDKYQNIFKYILIDEYQDTNNSQFMIINKLSEKYKNIFVVGDDAQSIYSFRGANIKNILNFKLYYPNAKIFRLEQNYRSTEYIVKASNSLIKLNKNQIKKKNWTKNEKGNKIKIYPVISEIEEAELVTKIIYCLKRKNNLLKNKDFAILYRNNSQSRILEEIFIKNKIPYSIKGRISFYDRKEIKHLIGYLKLIRNPYDEESFLRIINYPNRGIGKITKKKILELSYKYKINPIYIIENITYYNHFLNINTKIKNHLELFLFAIKKFNNRLKEEAYMISKEIFFNFGLIDKKEELNENISDLLNIIKAYVKEEKNKSLLNFIDSVILDINECDSNNLDTVSMMTIHLSKGLEFPVVFIVGLEERIFPSLFSIRNDVLLEEERRLLYVAMTRAKKQIIISYSIKRYLNGNWIKSNPSRFMKEIDKKYVEVLKNKI